MQRNPNHRRPAPTLVIFALTALLQSTPAAAQTLRTSWSCEVLAGWFKPLESAVTAQELREFNERQSAEIFKTVYADEYFVPHFGKSIDRISNGELKALGKAIQRARRPCSSSDEVRDQLFRSSFLYRPLRYSRTPTSLGFTIAFVSEYAQQQRERPSIGSAEDRADLEQACQAARTRHGHALRQVDLLHYRWRDARKELGRANGAYVFDQAYKLSHKYVRAQREAIEELKGLEPRARTSGSAELQELCLAEGLPVRTLRDAPQFRTQLTPSSTDDPAIAAIRDAPSSVRDPLSVKPAQFDDPFAAAINDYLTRDCSRLTTVLNSRGDGDAILLAIVASSIERASGYCRATTFGTAIHLGLARIRGLHCTTPHGEPQTCTFEAKIHCEITSVFGQPGENEKVSDLSCSPIRLPWRAGVARLTNDDDAPTIVSLEIQ